MDLIVSVRKMKDIRIIKFKFWAPRLISFADGPKVKEFFLKSENSFNNCVLSTRIISYFGLKAR